MTSPRPSFLDAYLVAENSMGAPAIGVVRKERNIWRVLRFGVDADQQPRQGSRPGRKQAPTCSSWNTATTEGAG